MTLSRLFEDSDRSVFRLEGANGGPSDAALERGWQVITLDTAGVLDKDGYMVAVDDAFDLPDWFRHSWDTLDECLRALDLDDPDGVLVVWDNWNDFAVADPDAFETAIEVFQDATVAWRDDKIPGAVVLRGHGPETDLPTLSD
ncbi:MAG: barstar family protein [Actinomycetes bacterium]